MKQRFVTLNYEEKLLNILPSMPRCQLMLQDIQQSHLSTDRFRSHFLQQMVESSAWESISEEWTDEAIDMIMRPGRLTIYSLTATVWPNFLLQPLKFTSLQLPYPLQLMKDTYQQYFVSNSKANQKWLDSTTTNNSEFNAGMMKGEFPVGYEITGSEENGNKINGRYFMSGEIKQGYPIYIMEENYKGKTNRSLLEFSTKSNSWQIKKAVDQGKNTGWAFCKLSPAIQDVSIFKYKKLRLTEEQMEWFVWKKSQKEWIRMAIVVKEIYDNEMDAQRDIFSQSRVLESCFSNNKRESFWMEANPLYLLPPKEEPQKALRQLIWCHAVGSVLLQCHFSNTDSCFLRVNEPQAALLMQFNNTDCVNDDSQLDILTKSPILTYNQLFQALRVSDEELQAILRSLVDSDNPILDINSNSDNSIHIEGWPGYISLKSTDSFKLSVAFRSKLLGDFQETHPIMCSSIDFEYQINASIEIFID